MDIKNIEMKLIINKMPNMDGVIINNNSDSLKNETSKMLESKGIRFIQFHPDTLLAGGGSLGILL